MNEFKTYHPIVSFVFFAFIIILSMFFLHPFCLAVSLIGAVSYMVISGERKLMNLLYVFPIAIGTAMLNPVFNHEGSTVLTYFKNGNPLTAESLYFGIAAACMLCVTICWFTCFNSVITFDKLVYLFGRILPSFSLILSMSLRFIPRFGSHYKDVRLMQKSICKNRRNKIQRLTEIINAISATITWSLENAAETADSMTGLGYGLSKRTSFKTYAFSIRDICVLCCMTVLGIYILAGIQTGGISYRYFPTVAGAEITPYAVSVFSAHFLFCMLPVIIEITEVLRWKSIKSKI